MGGDASLNLNKLTNDPFCHRSNLKKLKGLRSVTITIKYSIKVLNFQSSNKVKSDNYQLGIQRERN